MATKRKYRAVVKVVDTRPARQKGKEAPEGGWATKSGRRTLGTRPVFDAADGAEALDTVSAMLGKVAPAVRASILSVSVEAYDPTTTMDENPFGESD